MAKKSNRLPESPRLEEMKAVAAEHGGKFTLLDMDGNMVIAPVYDYIGQPEIGICLVRRDGKYGYVKTDGTVLVEPTYEKAGNFAFETAAVCVNGKWGFIDKTGKMVIEPQFEEQPRFCEGVAAVKIDGKWGYINLNGKLIVPAIYESAQAFDSGLGAVRLNGKTGFVSETGETVIPPTFDSIKSGALMGTWHCDALAVASENGAMGIINRKGEWVLPAKYQNVMLSISMAASRQSVGDEVIGKFEVEPGGCGLISVSGRIVAQPVFKEINEYTDGIAAARDSNGKWGFINLDGEWVIAPQYAAVHDFRGALANVSTNDQSFAISREGKVIGKACKVLKTLVGTELDIIPDRYVVKKDGKWGLLDGEFNELLPFEYDDIDRWGDTTNIVVRKEDKYGLTDVNGVELLPVKYHSIDIVRPNNPLAYVAEDWDSNVGAVNADGKWVIRPDYQRCSVYGTANRVVVEKDDLCGLHDLEGNEVHPCSFETISSFTDGMACARKDGKWGIIDADGNWIIRNKFDQIDDPSEGLAFAKESGKWGYVNMNGEWVINPEWNTASSISRFVGGVAGVKDDSGKFVLINKRGEALTKPSSTLGLYAIADGMRRVKVGRKYGYLTETGEMAIKPAYDDARDFENGWALVNMKVDKVPVWTFINHEGCYGPTYESEIWLRRLTKVKEGGKIALLDSNGVMIAPFIFSRVDDTKDGFTPAQIAGF
jgi:hypothetical protein